MKTVIAALVASFVSVGALAQASAPAKTMPMKAPAAMAPASGAMAKSEKPMKKAKKSKKAASAA